MFNENPLVFRKVNFEKTPPVFRVFSLIKKQLLTNRLPLRRTELANFRSEKVPSFSLKPWVSVWCHRSLAQFLKFETVKIRQNHPEIAFLKTANSRWGHPPGVFPGFFFTCDSTARYPCDEDSFVEGVTFGVQVSQSRVE